MTQHLIDLLDEHLPPRAKIPLNSVWNFPGLSRNDTQVLHHAITVENFQPSAWWFNVPLSDTPPWGRQQGLARFYQQELHLYALRADLIFVSNNRLYCCEIKPEARSTALGQVLLMSFLLANTLHHQTDVHPLILCDQASNELAQFCHTHDILVVQLNPQEQPALTPPDELAQ